MTTTYAPARTPATLGRPVRRHIPFKNTRVKLPHLARLCRSWARLEHAGVPTTQTLTILADTMENQSYPLSEALDAVQESVQRSGKTLAEALSEHERVFGANFLTCVHAGESTATLTLQFERLETYFLTEHATRRGLIRLAIYPIVLSLLATFTVYLIVYKVVPQLAELVSTFADFQLPWPTRFVIWAAEAAQTWGALMLALGALFGAIGFAIAYSGSEDVRFAVAKWVLRVPVLGTLVLYRNLASAFFTMGLLQSASGNAPFVLKRGAAMAQNLYVRDALLRAADQAQQGRTINGSFAATRILPAEAQAMLDVAQKSGTYDEMFEQLGEEYTKEVEYYRQMIMELIKPATIIVFGGIIGLVVVSFYWPMLEIFRHVR
jgi:type IV pilus assembly protein PilC